MPDAAPALSNIFFSRIYIVPLNNDSIPLHPNAADGWLVPHSQSQPVRQGSVLQVLRFTIDHQGQIEYSVPYISGILPVAQWFFYAEVSTKFFVVPCTDNLSPRRIGVPCRDNLSSHCHVSRPSELCCPTLVHGIVDSVSVFSAE